MKEDKLLSLIGDIDDEYIKEAAEYKIEIEKEQKPKAVSFWVKYGSLAAACVLIVVIAASGLLPGQGNTADSVTDGQGAQTEKTLPTLAVENYEAKVKEPEKKIGNPSKERSGNPWEQDAELDSLPVYENMAYVGESDGAAVVSDSTLNEEINQIAEQVDATVSNVEYSKASVSEDESPSSESSGEQNVFKAVASTDLGTITVTASNFTKIEYSTPQTLPAQYTVPAEELTDEIAEKITEYLLGQYGALMNFSNPKASVRILYKEDGSPVWIFAGYDDRDNLKEQIVSYNLKRMRFELDEYGQLTAIVMTDNLASGEKIEEYPIISEETARTLLNEGKYISNKAGPPAAEIENATLVYLTGPECNIFMPYYAFDVYAGEESDGLIQYSTYYVPAVKEEYLNKMPDAEAEAEAEGN